MSQNAKSKSRFNWKKSLMRMLFLVSFAVAIFGGLIWGFQRKAMYPGVWMNPGQPLALPENAEYWEHAIKGGTVNAILLPAEGVTAEAPGPAVIFTHGNGEFIDQWAHDFRNFTQRGITVLLPEYRGYGDSAGKPSQRGIVEDLAAFRERLIALETVDPDRLIYVGRSLGGGFAAQLAEQHPPAAMVLSSTFTSAADAAHGLTGLPRWLIRDRLEVRGVLENFAGPVLILHGEDDNLLPIDYAEANAAAAKQSELVIYPRTGHENMPQGFGRWEDLKAFLAAHGFLAPED